MRINHLKITVKPKTPIMWVVTKTKDQTYMAVCDELNLTLSDDTIEELEKTIKEALSLFIIDLHDDDELRLYAKEHNWKVKYFRSYKLQRLPYVTQVVIPWEFGTRVKIPL